MEADIFIPCFVDQLYPESGFSLVKVLEKFDVRVHYNANQTCCGQMAFNSGFWDEAKELGIKFIQDFNTGRPVVGISASCLGYVKKHFERLFYNTPWHLENHKLQSHLFEVTDFLVNVLKIKDIDATFNAKITFHDSCAALREYGLKDEPRILLRMIKGLELVEMVDRDTCCGFGGTFAVKFEAISSAMTEQKVKNAMDTGAEYIVSTDLSCLMQMESYIKKQKLNIKTMHIIDLLAKSMAL